MYFILTAVLAVTAMFSSAPVQSQTYPHLEHKTWFGTIRVLQNNSFIDRSLIDNTRSLIDDTSYGALRCVNDNPACCSGNWFDTRGEIVYPLETNSNFSFYTNETLEDGRGVYSLQYRSSGPIVVGVFRCDVNCTGDIESLYVYIGSNTIGK